MRIGSLPTNARKRAVEPYIQLNTYDTVTAVSHVAYTYPLAPTVAALDAINDLYAEAADPVSISVNLVLTPDTEETYAAAIMEQLAAVCATEAVPITSANVTTLSSATEIQISVFAVGKKSTDEDRSVGAASNRKPNSAAGGKDLVLAGAIGLGGTAAIADAKSEELLRQFALPFVRKAEKRREELSLRKITEIAAAHSAGLMCALSEGGVFAGLWKLGQRLKTGLDVDLKAITLHQETVEICEVFGLNPYLLHSTGSVLIQCENGSELVNALHRAEIEAAVIGVLTDSNDRRILNDGEVRFLDLPAADEMYQLF